MPANLSAQELDDIYSFAVQLGKDAGKMLLDAAMLRCQGGKRDETAHVEKMNAVDLVTQTDEGRIPVASLGLASWVWHVELCPSDEEAVPSISLPLIGPIPNPCCSLRRGP